MVRDLFGCVKAGLSKYTYDFMHLKNSLLFLGLEYYFVFKQQPIRRNAPLSNKEVSGLNFQYLCSGGMNRRVKDKCLFTQVCQVFLHSLRT